MWNRLHQEIILANSVDCLKNTRCVSKCTEYNWLLIFISNNQGRTDHLETWALPEGPGCPWYLFHRLF
ncbi:unnamed protein product [Staurois parvus]|uniref:Uncharacterized protein n=1 Tax=Staurois parvus TaxID=386267 RepID=A0ABN9F5M7_9NEOB|nr:unnamed protein product [Staurois parvus]